MAHKKRAQINLTTSHKHEEGTGCDGNVLVEPSIVDGQRPHQLRSVLDGRTIKRLTLVDPMFDWNVPQPSTSKIVVSQNPGNDRKKKRSMHSTAAAEGQQAVEGLYNLEKREFISETQTIDIDPSTVIEFQSTIFEFESFDELVPITTPIMYGSKTKQNEEKMKTDKAIQTQLSSLPQTPLSATRSTSPVIQMFLGIIKPNVEDTNTEKATQTELSLSRDVLQPEQHDECDSPIFMIDSDYEESDE